MRRPPTAAALRAAATTYPQTYPHKLHSQHARATLREMQEKGILTLKDGHTFEGYFFGSTNATTGEAVFTTGMVGYPETLTDPSYRGQILVLTYPLVGNYGVPPSLFTTDHLSVFFESEKIHIRGLIVSEEVRAYSHREAIESLDAWMAREGVPGLSGIDTRALTRLLREKGTVQARIDPAPLRKKNAPAQKSKERDVAHPVSEVSRQEKILYPRRKKTVLLIDCGVKHNIIRSLLARNVSVIRVPWDYDFSQEHYDGICISNGPGNPEDCVPTIAHLKAALEKTKPIFGICLGNQLLALAAGARTYKLPFGHRSQNQPCREVGSKRCFITSQNHGYAVVEQTLPAEWEPWFINANDGTNEGIRHKEKPFSAVQFHPEAAPGPTDTAFLFDAFVRSL